MHVEGSNIVLLLTSPMHGFAPIIIHISRNYYTFRNNPFNLAPQQMDGWAVGAVNAFHSKTKTTALITLSAFLYLLGQGESESYCYCLLKTCRNYTVYCTLHTVKWELLLLAEDSLATNMKRSLLQIILL